MIAGEPLRAGAVVTIGSDGRVYAANTADSWRYIDGVASDGENHIIEFAFVDNGDMWFDALYAERGRVLRELTTRLKATLTRKAW